MATKVAMLLFGLLFIVMISGAVHPAIENSLPLWVYKCLIPGSGSAFVTLLFCITTRK